MGGIQNILESGNPIPTINENGQMVDFVTVYAKDPNTTTGLTWGYFGGNWGTFSPATGTLTLTDNATNYIVVSRTTGAVSFSTSTTNWNDNVGFARCYIAPTSGGDVTTIEDKRCGPLGILSGADGAPGASGAGSSGSGTPFFFDHTVILTEDTDSVGVRTLQRNASDDTQELISQAVTAQTLMMGPAFEDGALGITTIPGGQWSFLMYCYASATAGVNEIKPAIYIKQTQVGTVAITGTGTSRTATVTGGTPFIAGHAHADMEKCSWLRTPNAQLRITAYTSTTEVTVECLSTYVNESGQAYFIDKQLFYVTTGDVENTTVELKTVDSFQQSFACNLTDKIVIRHFAKTDSGSAKTLNLYYGGTQYYSHLLTPIAIKHNDQAGLNEGDFIHLTAAEYADLDYLKKIPQNSQSSNYTLVLGDAGKHLLHPSADTNARTFTVPDNGSVPFQVGTTVTFINQNGAGVATIAITTDTMRLAGAGTTGSRTLAANGIATAIKITSTEWIISGFGLT
jgi:hypothetical protein